MVLYIFLSLFKPALKMKLATHKAPLFRSNFDNVLAALPIQVETKAAFETLPTLQQNELPVMMQSYLCWTWCHCLPVSGPAPAAASESWNPEDWALPPPAHSPLGSGLELREKRTRKIDETINRTTGCTHFPIAFIFISSRGYLIADSRAVFCNWETWSHFVSK